VTATAASRRPAEALRIRNAAGALALLLASPASAQLAATISLDSDYRLRGYSLSGGHPAAGVQLSYDDLSGVYVGLLGLTELNSENLRFLGVVGNVGYAKRLSEHVTLDAGILRSQLRSAGDYRLPFEYTEVYAGGYVGPVVGRIYYSPDYRGNGVSTLYGELEAGFEPLPKWRLNGHVGAFVYLNAPYGHGSANAETDWRVSLSRQFGRVEIHSSVSGGGEGHYGEQPDRRNIAATIGTSVSF